MARRKSEPTDGETGRPEAGQAALGGTPAVPEEAAPTESPAEPPAEAAAEPVGDTVEPGTVDYQDALPEEQHEEHVVDEPGPSFAGRMLTWLLLLIAGAALGIWGAPRLAERLPSGLAPVAGWLTPAGQTADERVAALQASLETRLGDLEARIAGAESRGGELPTRDDVQALVSTAVGDLDGSVAGEIEALRQAVAGADGAETRQRLSRAEAAVQGNAAELAAIKEQIAGGAAAAAGETAEQVDLYRAEVDGLRAEMGTLRDRVADLAQRIDTVAAEAGRQVETARAEAAAAEVQATTAAGTAATQAGIAQIRAALASGAPFETAVETLAARMPVPDALRNAAGTGVSTLPELRDSFADSAHEAIRASIMASAGDSMLARSRAYFEAQIASRSLTPKDGPEPDAVLSRVEDRLRHEDLAGALAEAEQLPSEATDAMSGWLDAARRRLAAEQALATLQPAPAATN